MSSSGEQQVGVVRQIVVSAEHGAPGVGVAGGGDDVRLREEAVVPCAAWIRR